ncbi:hypothetical protein [Defluviicoccus vanus]|uniref:Uncharacterized protein n=1 Tax=Defluviicoccus vanus TaxID=111831 RepID=A0A7H1N178_9PROT|nr:hypothetical protein [Defluviicoccus vanus]QNT69464.1 hypothetical protein HQ394_09155 [Defluviicoccus vanus]
MAIVVSLFGLGGCVGPPALRQSVLGYDETVGQLDQDILLLNVARLSDDRPPHFTVTSSIAATFNFETGGSIGGSVFEGSGDGPAVPQPGVARLGESYLFDLAHVRQGVH